MPGPLRDRILSRMSPVALNDGERLFQQGDAADYLYQVVSGRIVVTHLRHDGSESIVTFFASGDCVGEQGLIDGLPRANSAAARGPTELLELGQANFSDLRATHSEIDEVLLQLLSQRFRQLLKRIEEEAAWSLEKRLARRLVSLGDIEAYDGNGPLDLSMRLTQSDLARWVGFSRQRVNGALGDLQRKGLVSILGTRVRIENLAALRDTYKAD